MGNAPNMTTPTPTENHGGSTMGEAMAQPVCSPWHDQYLYLSVNFALRGTWHIPYWPLSIKKKLPFFGAL